MEQAAGMTDRPQRAMRDLPSVVSFKTKAGNHYLHSRNVNQFLLLHPIMVDLLAAVPVGDDPRRWIEALRSEGIMPIGLEHESAEDLVYYLSKLSLLSESSYFDDSDVGSRFSGRVTQEQVRMLVANLKHVVFEVTDLCNLDCRYCGYGDFYADHDDRTGKQLDFALARILIDYLQGHWNSPLNTSHKMPVYLSFFGGEPLLNFDFIRETVSYVRTKRLDHNAVRFGMTTNATRLEQHMDFLVENDFSLLLSLDGDEGHNEYRVFKSGKPAYPEIIRNVTALKNRYPAYFRSNVRFTSVLHNRNTVRGILTYFTQTFDKVPDISAIRTVGVPSEKQHDFLQAFQNPSVSKAETAACSPLEVDIALRARELQGLTNVLHRCSGFCYTDYNHLLELGGQQPRIPTGSCLPFGRKMFLTVNGKILPCERIGQDHSLGFVRAGAVELDAKKIANAMNKRVDAVRNMCISCYNAETCGNCIYHMDRRLGDIPGKCSMFMTKDQMADNLSAHLSTLEEKPDLYTDIMEKVAII